MPLLKCPEAMFWAALRRGFSGTAVRRGTVGFRGFLLPWVLSGGGEGESRGERGTFRWEESKGKVILWRTP